MEYEEEGEEENVTQMATRLTRVLDYQQEVLSIKRRYVQQRWPENSKKHKTLGLPSVRYVPESVIREEKEFSGIKSLVENGVTLLYQQGARNNCQSYSLFGGQLLEPPLSRVHGMTDLEVINHVPAFLCSLNKWGLKTLFSSLSGRPLATSHRYILEREIKKELSKIALPSSESELPEALQKMAAVVRSSSSYRHTLGSANPSVTFIPTMPSCALEAARKAFACVRNFPTPIVAEIGKLLIFESNNTSPVVFRHKTHLRTVKAVNKEVAKVLMLLREEDPLPACIEGALHVISLSARILFGHDGGLAGILKPLPAEKLVLEKEFRAAYNQIEKLNYVNLSRVCNILGKGVVWPPFRKQLLVGELQRVLIDSMHCIYAFDSFPGHFREAIQLINSTTDKAKMECNDATVDTEETACSRRLSKEGKTGERIGAEIEAALNVSAAIQSVAWECYDSRHGYRLKMTGESTSLVENETSFTTKVDHTEAKKNPLLSMSIPELNMPSLENTQHAVKIETERLEDGGPHVTAADLLAPRMERTQPDADEHYVQDVQRFADEAATIVYVIIGSLLKETARQSSFFMNPTTVGYLQMGLDKLQHDNALASNLSGGKVSPACSENINANELVLGIAKELKTIPESVISEVELRMAPGIRYPL